MAGSGDVRGELALSVEGEAFTLAFTPNALCDLEEETGKTVVQWARDIEAVVASEDISVRDLRLLFHVGLSEYHPDIDRKGAGKIMHRMGLVEAASKVMEAFMLAFPDGDDADDAGQDDAPGKVPARTG